MNVRPGDCPQFGRTHFRNNVAVAQQIPIRWDVESGKNTCQGYWTYDLFASSWSTPLIVSDLVYVADLDGEVAVFKVAKECELVAEQNIGIPLYSTPVVASGVLYIAAFNTLLAIAE